MYIESLKLKNFRSYSDLDIEFSKGLNFLTGLNGEGKTNVLEAISLLSLGKSFVTSDEKECITISENFSKVESKINKRNNSSRFEIVISNIGKKVTINGKEIKKISELSGKVFIVTFDPNDVSFYKNGSREKRKFIDVSLSMLSPAYLSCISLFKKLLKNRNILLKEQNVNIDLIEVIDKQIAPVEYEIVKMRNKFIKELDLSISKIYKKMNIDTGESKLEYLSVIPFENNKDKFIENIITLFKDNYETDMRRKSTSRGIHHDDMIFTFRGSNIAITGSQGQNRISALILKLALADLIKEKYNEEPILLLDDVLSELDENHQKSLGILLREYTQTFLTGTEIPNVIQVDSEYIVSNHSMRRK